MPTILRDGATIGYDVDGADDGTALLLYHGTTMDRLAWDMVIAALPTDHGLRFVQAGVPGLGRVVDADGAAHRRASSSPTGSRCSTTSASTASTSAGYSLGAVIAAATAAQAGGAGARRRRCCAAGPCPTPG